MLFLVGAGRCAFQRRQLLEEEAMAEFRVSHGANELFDDADEAVRWRLVRTSSTRKYCLIITTAIGALVGIYCLVAWRIWAGTEAFPDRAESDADTCCV